MDKKDKSLDDLFKNSMNQGANPFLNAASLLGGKCTASHNYHNINFNYIHLLLFFSLLGKQ